METALIDKRAEDLADLKALYHHMRDRVQSLRDSGKTIYPAQQDLLSAFKHFDFDSVKVVLLGQDPFFNENQATGMSFSVPNGVKLPVSLKNIFKELEEDLGIKNSTGDLDYWAQQGVLLLNRVLSVEAGRSGSHRDIGWEEFSNKVISYLSTYSDRVVFILWGKDALEVKALIDESRHKILTATHPSPMSAHKGFFGCKHFSQANQFLVEAGKEPIDWSLSHG